MTEAESEPPVDEFLAHWKRQIIDNRQRAELPDFSGPDFDFINDNPEFVELMKFLEEDLAGQRDRVRELERTGAMPPAPGVTTG